MKTIITMISLMTILVINSYGQSTDIKALLQKPETRKEVFNAILNDHNYFTEFMGAMHGNQHAMAMWNNQNKMTGNSQVMGSQGQRGMNGQNTMTGNSQMMGSQGQMGMNGQNQMMDRSYMMNMMNHNPAMMKALMDRMMDVVSTDSTMSKNMISMMYSHPLMAQMMTKQENHNGITSSYEGAKTDNTRVKK
jgi:hypothetical protein